MPLEADRRNAPRQGGICLAGHPFAPIGIGEHVRCSFRALRSVAMRPSLLDIYKRQAPTPAEAKEFGPWCRDGGERINILHVNGDEVQQVMTHLSDAGPFGGYHIVYPAWELSRYPDEWAIQLDRFDEIWAPSEFVREALAAVCKRPVFHMPLACEVLLTSFLPRRYFGIPEAAYVFLFFYDVRSFWQRKNPGAVITAFRRALAELGQYNPRLVLKVNGADLDPAAIERLHQDLGDMRDRVTVITRPMSDNEVKNLVRCCDCFLSLHRSEGFGRGMAEAMYLGKPVIATGYSGNLDFMTADTSLLVPYTLVPVSANAYPHWQNQVWAEPDVEFAAHCMIGLVKDPRSAHSVGQRASRHIRTSFGLRAAGLRYRTRLSEIDRANP